MGRPLLVAATLLTLAACDTAAPAGPTPDPDPDPEPEPIELDGYYVGSWQDGGADHEWRIGLSDDDGTLTGGDGGCAYVYRTASSHVHIACHDPVGEWDGEVLTFRARFASGETISFVGTVAAEGERLPGTVSGSHGGDSFAAGTVFERQ